MAHSAHVEAQFHQYGEVVRIIVCYEHRKRLFRKAVRFPTARGQKCPPEQVIAGLREVADWLESVKAPT